MKKTMLTCKTLDRFEAEYNTAQYTPDEIEKVEFAAYVANMNTCNHSEWTESDIFKEFLRVLAIDKITVTKKESPRAGGKQMKAYNEIKKELEARKDRSAWSKGVTMYALELLEEYQERAAYEGREAADRAEFKAWLLNGADSWESYSYGGSSLIYNGDIVERLCCPSEYKRTREGERKPNSREEWLDVQARALYQAACRLSRIAF